MTNFKANITNIKDYKNWLWKSISKIKNWWKCDKYNKIIKVYNIKILTKIKAYIKNYISKI